MHRASRALAWTTIFTVCDSCFGRGQQRKPQSRKLTPIDVALGFHCLDTPTVYTAVCVLSGAMTAILILEEPS
jgi:hypothetical protein